MIVLDLPPQTQNAIQSIADKQGLSIEQFILMGAYEKALNFTQSDNEQDTPIWYASNNDKALIQAMLDNPPTPNDKLKELMKLSLTVQDNT